MYSFKRWSIDSLRAIRTRPWPDSTAAPALLNACNPVEEEETPYYNPKRFYPARLGETLHDRYQLATKLGFGTSSTVWLARDLYQWRWSPERYVSLKINVSDRKERRDAQTELQISKIISDGPLSHHGRHFVRHLLDHFTLEGPYHRHSCLIFEPLREPLWLTKTRFNKNTLPSDVLKIVVRMLLHGLDYLHTCCHVIHTDLKLDNIMTRLEDNSILERSALDEFQNPLPQKVCEDRRIYLSRNQYGSPTNLAKVLGLVTITDFGFAVCGDGPHYGAIQVEPFRAPEVILDAGWTYSADIWNLGVMLWDLLENRSLFEPVDSPSAEYDEVMHLACITALLGSPPKELLSKGRRTSMFYDSNGNLKQASGIPKMSFETILTQIKEEDKKMFINFVKRMFSWEPKHRSTAKDLLDDPWLDVSSPS